MREWTCQRRTLLLWVSELVHILLSVLNESPSSQSFDQDDVDFQKLGRMLCQPCQEDHKGIGNLVTQFIT